METDLYLQRCLFLNPVLIVYLYCFIYVYQLKTIKYVYITYFLGYIFEAMFVITLFLILPVNKCTFGPGYTSKGVGMIRVDFGPILETVYIDIILNTIIER
jgi:hypothetical protein